MAAVMVGVGVEEVAAGVEAEAELAGTAEEAWRVVGLEEVKMAAAAVPAAHLRAAPVA